MGRARLAQGPCQPRQRRRLESGTPAPVPPLGSPLDLGAPHSPADLPKARSPLPAPGDGSGWDPAGTRGRCTVSPHPRVAGPQLQPEGSPQGSERGREATGPEGFFFPNPVCGGRALGGRGRGSLGVRRQRPRARRAAGRYPGRRRRSACRPRWPPARS